MRVFMKFCSVAIMVLLVIAALGPAKWTPRTALGWEIDHFVGYFAITSIVCFAWPRPFVVRGALTATAVLLEGLQGLTPDRTPIFWLHSMAQAGCWQRLCLPNSSSGHRGGSLGQ
jgi:hypothetical protein